MCERSIDGMRERETVDAEFASDLDDLCLGLRGHVAVQCVDGTVISRQVLSTLSHFRRQGDSPSLLLRSGFFSLLNAMVE